MCRICVCAERGSFLQCLTLLGYSVLHQRHFVCFQNVKCAFWESLSHSPSLHVSAVGSEQHIEIWSSKRGVTRSASLPEMGSLLLQSTSRQRSVMPRNCYVWSLIIVLLFV